MPQKATGVPGEVWSPPAIPIIVRTIMKVIVVRVVDGYKHSNDKSNSNQLMARAMTRVIVIS